MSRTVDGVLVAWGERTSWKGKGGKKGKDIKFKNGKLTGGNKQSKGSGSGAAIRSEMSPKQAKAKLGRTLKKSPEVMVKITGAGKTVEKIKAHLDYISRDDKLKLENEEGREVDAEETINRFTEKGAKIEREGEGARSKSAFHIVLSMPQVQTRKESKTQQESLQKQNWQGISMFS
ncbi:hypothetical protein [Iodobacter fluviatilis]|uniref:hypothetical protein n=1 Tax=Iodobacter fluviatilis TaxID=537 RepID=UPI00101FF6D8|nr:hypothetical protein [Iodobacter fluviatilis]